MADFEIEKVDQKKTGQDFVREKNGSKSTGFKLEKETKVEKFQREEQREINAFREVVKNGTGNKELDKVLDKDKKYQKLRSSASHKLALKDKVDKKLTRKAYKRKVDKDGNISYVLKRKYKTSKGKELIKDAADKGINVSKNTIKKGFQSVARDAGGNFKSDGTTEDYEKAAKGLTEFAKHSVKGAFSGPGSADKLAKKSMDLQKEMKKMQKKMNQRRGVLNYQRKHKNTATAQAKEQAKKQTKKKMEEMAAKALTSKVLIFAAVLILISCLLGSCVSIFSGLMGGVTGSAAGAYIAPANEIQQAEDYFHRYETSLVMAIYRFEEWYLNFLADRHGAVNGVYVDSEGIEKRFVFHFDLDKIYHDPNVLIAYLTVLFDDFNFNEYDLGFDEVAKHIVDPLFVECYRATPVSASGSSFYGFPEESPGGGNYIGSLVNVIARSVTISQRFSGSYDAEGNPIMEDYKFQIVDVYIGSDGYGNSYFRSLEDVVQDRINSMTEDKQQRYEILRGTMGLLYVASDVLGTDYDLREHVTMTFGYQPYDSSDGYMPCYTYDNWVPTAHTLTETYNNYVRINTNLSPDVTDPGGRIYAGAEGTVISVTGDEVAIKYSSSTWDKSRYLWFKSLEEIYVTQGQTVTHDTMIGKSIGTADIYYYEKDLLGSITYRNPLIYIR